MENEIKQDNVSLVVTEETIGSLTTNACQIRDLVKNAMDRYDVSKYSIDDIASAKADKALLNKAQKALNKKRIDMEKEFMSPFQEFKSVINDTCNMIKTTVSNIDVLVKKKEEQDKQEKGKKIGNVIKELWPELIQDKKLLKHVYDETWLNKSVSIKTVYDCILAKKNTYDKDMETINTLGEEKDAAMIQYNDCYDISTVISFAMRLKKQKEEKAAQKEKERLEEIEKTEETEKEIDKEDQPQPVTSTASDSTSPYSGDIHEAELPDDLLNPENQENLTGAEETRMYVITTTPEMFSKLETVMKNSNIEFNV